MVWAFSVLLWSLDHNSIFKHLVHLRLFIIGHKRNIKYFASPILYLKLVSRHIKERCFWVDPEITKVLYVTKELFGAILNLLHFKSLRKKLNFWYIHGKYDAISFFMRYRLILADFVFLNQPVVVKKYFSTKPWIENNS